ncbi:uncharacterized protein LOC124910793 [Impatiens glandulifera]|uniref:uncharacterized protein LOC124910793 n=1 Tax=Impatiens glandulifera TaxID=253017 RepID=UPI001FB0830B|nr:uncharacterized protein LOC124910793 [Impatiens glandulifera]
MSGYQVYNYHLYNKLEAVIEKMQTTSLESSTKRVESSTKRVVDCRLHYQILDRANLPSDFKLPEMEKFDGSGNPIVHLKVFIRTMALHQIREEAMIVLFPKYLSKSALNWFYHPDVETFTDFESIVKCFVDQFYFNIVADKLSMCSLECTKQNEDEKLIDFFDRWRKQVSLVVNRPDQSKLMKIFRGNMIYEWIFKDKTFSSFSDLISRVIRFENGCHSDNNLAL